MRLAQKMWAIMSKNKKHIGTGTPRHYWMQPLDPENRNCMYNGNKELNISRLMTYTSQGRAEAAIKTSFSTRYTESPEFGGGVEPVEIEMVITDIDRDYHT